MKRIPQLELAGAEQVFNLHSECGVDPVRVMREREEAARREAEAKAFAARCQRTFEQTPGFVGCDAPKGPGQSGNVVVEPGLVIEAMDFLKKRFHVNQKVDVDAGRGLCLQVVCRKRRAANGKRRVTVSFERPVQYELPL